MSNLIITKNILSNHPARHLKNQSKNKRCGINPLEIVSDRTRWETTESWTTMFVVSQSTIKHSAVNDSTNTSYIDRWPSISVSSPWKAKEVGKRQGRRIPKRQAGKSQSMHPSPMRVEEKQSSCQSGKTKTKKNKSRKVLLARFFFGLAPATGLALCMVIQNLWIFRKMRVQINEQCNVT